MRHNASHLGYFFSEGSGKANRFSERFCVLNRISQKTDAFLRIFARFFIFVHFWGEENKTRPPDGGGGSGQVRGA